MRNSFSRMIQSAIAITLAVALVSVNEGRPSSSRPLHPKENFNDVGELVLFNAQWLTNMSKIANKYYRTKYRDEDHTETHTVNGRAYTVARPNHGTLHGIRQGLLAVDMAHLMEIQYPQSILGNWMGEQRARPGVGNNIYKKLFFASMFQRTGRESEQPNKAEYVLSTKDKFREEARKLSNVYDDDEEIEEYCDAFKKDQRGCNQNTLSYKAKIIGDILNIGHKLDLRRILKFDGQVIRNDVMEILNLPRNETKIVRIMWDLSGRYLKITGDKDMEPGCDKERQDELFVLSHDLDRANMLLLRERAVFWNLPIQSSARHAVLWTLLPLRLLGEEGIRILSMINDGVIFE